MNSINEANLVEMFLESALYERGLSKSSASSYLNDLKFFLMHFNHQGKSILNLTTVEIANYLASHNLKNSKRATVARKISTLRQFYLFLLSEKLIESNPALDLEHPKKEVRIPKALEEFEIQSLIAVVENETTAEGIRNYFLLEMLYSTGMRVSELVQLKLSVINNPVEKTEEHQVILINGKGNKDRIVIINKQAQVALQKYLNVRSQFLKSGHNDYLFPSQKHSGKATHLTRQMFFIIIKRIALKAGLDPNKISPHKLRHSFATHILQNGANMRIVQELLGHADITSTQIYTKVLSNQARDLVLNYHPLAKDKLIK